MCETVHLQKADLEHLISHLPLHSRDALVISKLWNSPVPQSEEAKPLGLLQLLICHKVKLLLQLFQAEILGRRHLSAAGDLPQHRHKRSNYRSSPPSCTTPNSRDAYFQKLHDGGVLRVVGIQSGLRGPLSDFFHVIQSRCSDI